MGNPISYEVGYLKEKLYKGQESKHDILPRKENWASNKSRNVNKFEIEHIQS